MGAQLKSKGYLVAGIVAVCAIVVWVWATTWNAAEPVGGPRVEISRDGETVASFFVEFATTREQQIRGLMGREHLPENAGMLFIYVPEQPVGMWMRNMLIPLDFLFADARGVVLQIAENVPPCPPEGPCPTIASTKPVKYVLEVPAGSVQRHGIAVGDVMRTVVDL